MKKFRITSKAGVVYGVYEGETPEEAFSAMIADGCDGCNVDGRSTAGTVDDWIIREVVEEGSVR